MGSRLWAKELDLKKELELIKRNMDREDEERRQAAEVREKRIELEFAESKLMLDLLTKLVNKQKIYVLHYSSMESF